MTDAEHRASALIKSFTSSKYSIDLGHYGFEYLCIAITKAIQRAEQRTACKHCNDGDIPWYDEFWMHTIIGSNIDCDAGYPDISDILEKAEHSGMLKFYHKGLLRGAEIVENIIPDPHKKHEMCSDCAMISLAVEAIRKEAKS